MVSITVRHSGEGGVVTIHDWTDNFGLSIHTLEGQEWRNYVKFNVARTNLNIPSISSFPVYQYEFLVWKVSTITRTYTDALIPLPRSIYTS